MPSPLVQQLDRDVYQIVARYLDAEANSQITPDTSIAVYQYIQSSNSSLRRKPKAVLISSIDRALALMERDNQEPEPQENGDELPRRNPKKRRRTVKPVPQSTTTMTQEDMGGVAHVFRQLSQKIGLPLHFPELYTDGYALGSHGVLLYGPSGCGKTTIARIFAAIARVPCIEVLSSTLVSNMSGDSEANIRGRFEEAKNQAPSLLLIDQIEIIAANRDTSQAQMDKRMVTQLLACMDDLRDHNNTGKLVMVLATTNRPDSLDPSLRGGGRFGTEINIGVPDVAARAAILDAHLRRLPCESDVDVQRLARMTAGYVGSDLRDLVEEALSWRRDQFAEALILQQHESEQQMVVDGGGTVNDEELKKDMAFWRRVHDKTKPKPPGFEVMTLPMEAFLRALRKVVPSAKKQGFASVPETTWDDIGALDDVREELQMCIVNQILHPDDYAAVGIDEPTGALLYGPPGCGKTMLAKAVANECQATFINVKGSELLNKYVGESEKTIRQIFKQARTHLPCLLFFDEVDALVPRRDSTQNEASMRVVSALLAELDGVEARAGIHILAATNRLDAIDVAMLRPGRFGTHIRVGLPSPEGRASIVRTLLRKKAGVINPAFPQALARSERCRGFSGADLAGMIRKASEQALKRKSRAVEECDFLKAIEMVSASVPTG